MLRDTLLAWFRSNVSLPVIHQDCARYFDKAAGGGENLRVFVGRAMSVGRKAYLVHCFADELFGPFRTSNATPVS